MKLEHEKLLSNFAFNFNLRRYTVGKIVANPLAYGCAAFLGFLVNFLTLGVIRSTSSLTFKVWPGTL